MTRTMLGFGDRGAFSCCRRSSSSTVIAVTSASLAVHWYMRSRRLEDVVAKTPWWLTGLVWAGMLFAS